MTTIRCPVCADFLTADGEASLTRLLTTHLLAVHEVRGLEDITSVNVPREHHPQDWEAMKRGELPVEREPGEDVEETILCPLCGERVYGHDGDDLSNHLQAHFGNVHDLGRSRALLARRE
ncbi:MAG: hypothetical protein ISF22_07310 [Methanomassiliicoccus sp.]|nr:hypothetical protein [Methanomassiliicoccus sp.]